MLEDDQAIPHDDAGGSRAEFLAILDRMTAQFCRAIRISLAVVADVRNGEEMEGLDTEVADSAHRTTSKPINPGAIGANGIFSSVHRSTEEENSRRNASQRIVVGSWLLTRETCSAVAAALTFKGYNAEASLYNEAGMLLVSTLTSLKHTGAAFAAHRAIQNIAQSCFDVSSETSIQQLPTQWASRLLREVSETDKIRDSTLRRSLGYSLGFLSLMRSEISCRPSPRPLCRWLLTDLVKMSLPSRRDVESLFSKIGIDENLMERLFTLSSKRNNDRILADGSYEVRTRVHALNALRLILLDAPLSQEVFPFVGLAIISSVVGYTDAEWSIRNSSTMLFAATMLRTIDSDKNATNKDITSSNAITLHELFRAYPSLDAFLLAVLKGGVSGALNEQQGLSLPPILPILLLMGRVQSVSKSGKDSATLAEPFVPVVFDCLQHRYLSIRKAAARALRNLSSDDKDSATSMNSIMAFCQHTVSMVLDTSFSGGQGDHWNRLHGSLLTIRELVTHSEEAVTVIRENGTLQELFQISRVYCGSTILVPPPSIAVAIDILATVSTESEQSLLLKICFEIVAWLECKTPRRIDCIGAADLCASAASVAAKSIASNLWGESCSNFELPLSQLDSLFKSKLVDARLVAIKAFKKSIYQGLDQVSSNTGTQRILGPLLKMLLSALSNELDRDTDHSMDDVGAHPPTLRRLSRCLVETIEIIVGTGIGILDGELSSDCRDTALAALERGKGCISTAQDYGSLTMLDGNALELLSFVFAKEGRSQKRDMRLFLSVVERLSNPYCEWRVRHSAAVALARIRVASEHDSTMDATDPSTQLSLLRSWLKLMQDDDIDVRYSAARILTTQTNTRTRNCVSEIALVSGYTGLCNLLPDDTLIQFLLAELYSLSDNLEEKFDAVINEYRLSSETVDDGTASSLTNVESKRKIFEDEDPNSYHEQSIPGQLAVIEFAARRGCFLDSSSQKSGTYETAARILTRSNVILSKIQSLAPFGDLLHDITRNNTIFPALHNLLLGAIVAVMLPSDASNNRGEFERVRRIALDIASMYEEQHWFGWRRWCYFNDDASLHSSSGQGAGFRGLRAKESIRRQGTERLLFPFAGKCF